MPKKKSEPVMDFKEEKINSNPFTNNSNLNSSTNLVKEESKNEEKKPIINVDSDSKVIDDNVISDDEFFDDFFGDDDE